MANPGISTTGINAKPDGRHRFQFRFWMDVVKPSQLAIAEELEKLKANRKMAPLIRDAVRLILDLQQGKTDVLDELFPFVRASAQPLAAPIRAERSAPATRIDRPERPARLDSVPRIDDIELDVQASTSSDENANYNMLISMELLTGSLDSLPTEVIEYGLERGKFNGFGKKASALLQERASLGASSKASSSGGIKTLAGSDVTFDSAVDDDFLDGLL